MITRSDADALIETQVANEIFEGTIRKSKALLRTALQTYVVALFDGFTTTVKRIFRKR